uniref:Methylcrotonoyl-CoA carboxylase subunit alpha, mitochondrial n=1 Tax=Lygus hesperus TaxID=30085 RepID=A0A0A9YXK0_LYGHE
MVRSCMCVGSVEGVCGCVDTNVRPCAQPPQKTIQSLRQESANLFTSNTVFIEKYVENGRHLEVQIAGDCCGRVVHFYERDCSLQRRHQKILEQSPAPISQHLRADLCSSAVRIGLECNFQGLGTVEFLYDQDQKQLYFLEINPRLQVEHGVTELVTGVDLVSLQLQLATGAPLPFTQNDIRTHGHAIECRVYAENMLPQNSFV